ncbi:unnamed protein product, partial [Arabidopsis halleri]
QHPLLIIQQLSTQSFFPQSKLLPLLVDSLSLLTIPE